MHLIFISLKLFKTYAISLWLLTRGNVHMQLRYKPPRCWIPDYHQRVQLLPDGQVIKDHRKIKIDSYLKIFLSPSLTCTLCTFSRWKNEKTKNKSFFWNNWKSPVINHSASIVQDGQDVVLLNWGFKESNSCSYANISH